MSIWSALRAVLGAARRYTLGNQLSLSSDGQDSVKEPLDGQHVAPGHADDVAGRQQEVVPSPRQLGEENPSGK